MKKLTIEFDAEVGEATVNGVTYQVPFVDIPNASAAKIFAYGLQRIVNDKCGGADKTDEKKAEIATATLAAIKSGDIASRRTTAGEPAINAYIRRIVRAVMGDESKAKYDAIPSDDQASRGDFLWALYESAKPEARDAIMTAAEEAKAKDDAKRAAAKELASAIGTM